MGTYTSKPSEQALPSSPFARLPYEIRSQIWLETLAPRVIFLHPHPRLSPRADTFAVPRSAEVLPPTAFQNPPSEASDNEARSVAPKLKFIWPDWYNKGHIYTHFDAARPLDYKGTAPPVALLVCKESRDIALQNGYRIAFKNTTHHLEGQYMYKKFWDSNQLREKGVWVNFERDLIMLDILWRNGHPVKNSIQPLRLLSKLAPGDVRCIKLLGLGGGKGPRLSRPWNAPHIYSFGILGGRPDLDRVHEWLLKLGFESLREVWVDDDYDTGECNWVGEMR
jgi:hypothetical protein